jgi:hypothetical protein
MSLAIKVAEYDDIRGHVEYCIEVRDITGESWCFKRRYSALRFFHELLKKYEKRVPNFPPKKLFGNLNPEFLESRRKQIEQYFNSLAHIPEILHSAAFKDFIKPFDKSPIIKNKKNQKKLFIKEINEAALSATKKIVSECSNDFIDISPFDPINKEMKENLQKEYESGLKDLMIQFEQNTIRSIPENQSKLKKSIEKTAWFLSSFEILIQISSEKLEP